MHLDNAWGFNSKSTVLSPSTRGATRRKRVSACSQAAYCHCQLSKNDASPPSEKKPFYIIPAPEALQKIPTLLGYSRSSHFPRFRTHVFSPEMFPSQVKTSKEGQQFATADGDIGHIGEFNSTNSRNFGIRPISAELLSDECSIARYSRFRKSTPARVWIPTRSKLKRLKGICDKNSRLHTPVQSP